MVETRKPRVLSEPMEIFLMAAIARAGLNTLYSLQKTAGLQPGSLSSVINRLDQAGLLVRSEAARRGRRTMALTEHGEAFLQWHWRDSLDSGREMESILRSGTVALLMGEPGEAINFFWHAASERERHPSQQHLGSNPFRHPPIESHAVMRAEYESRRLEMEAILLHELGNLMVARFSEPQGE